MPKFKTMTVSAALGLTLSTALAACATRPPKAPPPAVVAVKVDAPKPPADLMACPVPPEGFPLDQVATLPPPVRAAAIRLARAYADAAGQLRRLIDFTDPGTCP